MGNHALQLTLREWINEGLITIFFVVVGLEIKRELVSGQLAKRRAALLPVVGGNRRHGRSGADLPRDRRQAPSRAGWGSWWPPTSRWRSACWRSPERRGAPVAAGVHPRPRHRRRHRCTADHRRGLLRPESGGCGSQEQSLSSALFWWLAEWACTSTGCTWCWGACCG